MAAFVRDRCSARIDYSFSETRSSRRSKCARNTNSAPAVRQPLACSAGGCVTAHAIGSILLQPQRSPKCVLT